MTHQVLRTPDSAFTNLKDYPFAPNYLEVDGMRVHYVDEGDREARVIFLLHGQPSWSYLYRHMIPVLVKQGFRVIAPDMIGFGKSDKPIDPEMHNYENHVKWMNQFVEQLNIRHAAAFMQDWGGMIGLRVLARQPQWLDRLVVANTALAQMNRLEKFMVPKVLKLMVLAAGKPDLSTLINKIDYGNWAGYFRHQPEYELGEVIQALSTTTLDDEEKRAYDAPFPSQAFLAGPRRMPELVAEDLDQVNADWRRLKEWEKPVLTLFSDRDPFLAGRGYDVKFQRNFIGAKDQPHRTTPDASHFLQEDQPQFLASQMTDWLKSTHFNSQELMHENTSHRC